MSTSFRLPAALAVSIMMVPLAAFAHPGHDADPAHIHWEIVALGLVAVVATAAVIRRYIRRR